MRRHPKRSSAYDNRHFPHQVIYLWDSLTIAERRVIMESSMQYDHRTWHSNHQGRGYLVYCFRERFEAVGFVGRHEAGKIVDPAEFDKLGNWQPAEQQNV